MHDHLLTLIVPLGGAALVGVLVLVVAGPAVRRARRAAARPRPEPHSVVHLLAGEGELRDAIERACRFEREVAEMLEERAARYESLLADPPSELRAMRVPVVPAEQEQRSLPA